MSREVGTESEDMLDKPPFAVFYGSLVLISDFCSLFFIFTVITKSTADMKLYKYVLLKLAICDLLFNVSIAMLVGPDLLCPLPAVVVRSPIGGLSETHAFVTIAITCALSVTVFTSINDCCFIRVCIFYQWNLFLQKLYSWKGVVFLVLVNGIVISVIVSTLWLAVNTNKEFLEVVTSLNMTQALGSYALEPETVYFYVDIHRPQVIPLIAIVLVGIVSVHTMNLYASSYVWEGVCKRKKNMSDRSFQSHRQLTLLVVCQNVVPALALSIPLIIVIISFLLNYPPDTFAEVIKHFVTFTLCIYPAMSVILGFTFIRPYKKFLISLFCNIRRKKRSQVSDVRMSRKESVGNESFDEVGYI